VESGAGELFQALRGGVAVSSVLVVRSRTAGYTQSSGTSVEGTSFGASTFLIFQIAVHLQREGVEVLNIGGARENETGLRSYKSDFGATAIDLQHVECGPASIYGRILRRVSTLYGGVSGVFLGRLLLKLH
jgi:hypothetical protein